MDDIFVDLRAAGLPTPSSSQGREDLAAQLGYSYKHLDNVMFGRKPYGGKLKVTIQKLVRAHEQARPAPLSPLNQTEPVEQAIIDQADDAVEPQAADTPRLKKRYRVVGRDVRVEQFTSVPVASFASPVAASEYADWLNDRLTNKEAD